MALKRFSRILNENPVHPAQAKAIVQAAWHETIQAFALLVKEDIPRSKGKFSEVASMQALSAMEKSLKAVIKAAKAGDEIAAKDALLDADQAAKVLMQAEEQQRAKHLTQFVFRAVKDRLGGSGADPKLVAKWHEIVTKEREIETGLAAFELAQDRATWLPNKELQDISLETEHDYVRALAYVEGMIKRHKDEMKKLGAILKTPKTIAAFAKKHGISMQYVERSIGRANASLRDEVNELDEWKRSLKWSYTRAKTQFKRQGNLFDAPAPTKARKTLAPKPVVARVDVPVGYTLQSDGTMKDHRGVALSSLNMGEHGTRWLIVFKGEKVKQSPNNPSAVVFNSAHEAAKAAEYLVDFAGLETRIEHELVDILKQYPSDNHAHKELMPGKRLNDAIEQFRLRKMKGISPEDAFKAVAVSLRNNIDAVGQEFEKARLPADLVDFLKTLSPLAAGKAREALLRQVSISGKFTTRFDWVMKNWSGYEVQGDKIQSLEATDTRTANSFFFVKDLTTWTAKFLTWIHAKHHTHKTPEPTPEPQIKPHGGSSAPRLGNTVAEVMTNWVKEQSKGDAGGFVLMGKAIAGPEMFWDMHSGKLMISSRSKTGIATAIPASARDKEEVEEEIRRGNFEIYRRAIKINHDWNKTATGGIAPLRREVLHQATGRQLEAAIIPEAQIAKFRGAASSWVHAYLDDHPQDVKLKVRDAIVDYYKENPTSWERVGTKRVGELVLSQLGINMHLPAKPGDTAIVNVPLAKRGNIDAQIDRFKKDQAAIKKSEAKTAAAQNRDAKALAKTLFAQHGEALIASFLSKNPSKKRKEVRDTLDSMVKWEPQKAITLFQKFEDELKKKDLTVNRHPDTPSNVRPLEGNIMAKAKVAKAEPVKTEFPKTEITVTPVAGGADVSFPKNSERLASFKSSFKGIRFDWDTKTWFVKGATAFNRAIKWANAEENGKSLAIQKTETQANASAELIAARINELVALGGSWIRGTATINHHDVKYDEAKAIARTLPNAHEGSMFWSFQPHTADDVSRIIAGFEKINAANKVAREFHANMASKVEAAIKAQHHNLMTIPGVATSGILIEYRFAYNEKALSIVRGLPGAKWQPAVKSWRFLPKTVEDVAAVVAGIQRIDALFASERDAERSRMAAKTEADKKAGKGQYIERVSRAPSVGSTIRRGANIVTITGHGRKYRADEDTSSLGGPIGAEGEYVLDVFYRTATDAERETFEAKENQAKSAADRAKLRSDAIATLNKSNDAPHVGHEPAGETIWQDQSQALHGFWTKVILTPDHQWLWHVTYDGSDGAAWGEYNLGHNLRGSRTKATPELISAIRDPNAAKTTTSAEPDLKKYAAGKLKKSKDWLYGR